MEKIKKTRNRLYIEGDYHLGGKESILKWLDTLKCIKKLFLGEYQF